MLLSVSPAPAPAPALAPLLLPFAAAVAFAAASAHLAPRPRLAKTEEEEEEEEDAPVLIPTRARKLCESCPPPKSEGSAEKVVLVAPAADAAERADTLYVNGVVVVGDKVDTAFPLEADEAVVNLRPEGDVLSSPPSVCQSFCPPRIETASASIPCASAHSLRSVASRLRC